MSTHHLDILGKIDDLRAINREYEDMMAAAERNNDTEAADRYRRLIKETDNKIFGLRNSPYNPRNNKR